MTRITDKDYRGIRDSSFRKDYVGIVKLQLPQTNMRSAFGG